MFEMKDWDRRLVASQRPVIPLAANKANVTTICMKTLGQMLRIKTGWRRVRPDILRKQMNLGHGAPQLASTRGYDRAGF
jgi:hypothetical protein